MFSFFLNMNMYGFFDPSMASISNEILTLATLTPALKGICTKSLCPLRFLTRRNSTKVSLCNHILKQWLLLQYVVYSGRYDRHQEVRLKISKLQFLLLSIVYDVVQNICGGLREIKQPKNEFQRVLIKWKEDLTCRSTCHERALASGLNLISLRAGIKRRCLGYDFLVNQNSPSGVASTNILSKCSTQPHPRQHSHFHCYLFSARSCFVEDRFERTGPHSLASREECCFLRPPRSLKWDYDFIETLT